MSGPTSYGTAQHIIKFALEDACRLAEGQEPTGEQYAKYLMRLSDLVSHYQTKGIKLWTQVDQSITLTAGTAVYTFGPAGSTVMTRPLRVVQHSGYYSDVNGIRRPLDEISRSDVNLLSQLTQQGPITQYYVDKQQTQLSVRFWMTPDTTAATGTAHLILQQQITNPTTITETMNFPNEWYLCLRWTLASELATGQPQEVQTRCDARAMQYQQELEDWDVEDTDVSFQPDQTRSGYGGGAFR